MTHDIDLAYLAGIIDGEGTISIAMRRNDMTFSPWVIVGNTNIEIIKEVKKIVSEIIGREIRWTSYKPQSAKWKLCYKISVYRHDEVRGLLSAVRPFLRGKTQQANIMLRYLDIAPGQHGSSEARMVTERVDLKNQIQFLNKRGPSQ